MIEEENYSKLLELLQDAGFPDAADVDKRIYLYEHKITSYENLFNFLQIIKKFDSSIDQIEADLMIDYDQLFKQQMHALLMGLHKKTGENSEINKVARNRIFDYSLLHMISLFLAPQPAFMPSAEKQQQDFPLLYSDPRILGLSGSWRLVCSITGFQIMLL